MGKPTMGIPAIASFAAATALVSACGALPAPSSASSPATSNLQASTASPLLAPPALKDPGDEYLSISGTSVSHLAVVPLASYNGHLNALIHDELLRRFGDCDFVTFEGPDPMFGGIGGWAWELVGDSSGANQALDAANLGAAVTIKRPDGSVDQHGSLVFLHDFIQREVDRTITSSDGRWQAQLARSGYPRDNTLVVRDRKLGKEWTWEPDSRFGDVYQDAQWFQPGVLVTVQGRPGDELVSQLHLAQDFFSEVLGPDSLTADASASGLTPSSAPRCTNLTLKSPQITYTAQIPLTSGQTVTRTWQGKLGLDSDGWMEIQGAHVQP